jgi:hypothetical protein
MTNDATQPGTTEPADEKPAHTGSGTKDPTGIEGGNPALDDTGKVKAEEIGEPAEQPEDPESLDLKPKGLEDEPAGQEEPDSAGQPAEPENS